MYNILLFDLDGTLTDSAEGILNSVAYALEKFGITVEDKTQLNKFIGPPLVESFKMHYSFSDEQCDTAVEYYREYFREKGIYENRLYDGIPELLKKLKSMGKTVALATSKPEVFAIKILEYFDIDKYFDFAAGASLDRSRNKKSDVISHVLSSLDVSDLSEVVMIGDRMHDIVGAQQNNIDSLGVLYGYGNLDELTSYGATHIAKTVEDILNYV